MTGKKQMLLFAMAVAILGITTFAVMTVKDRTYVPSAAYLPRGEPNKKIAVVYYSRSGHSEAVAREVARTLNAPIARIDADYPLNSAGQGKAIFDARAAARPKIRAEAIDLAPAQRVFLVSPIWMFRPATPLWAYVEQVDLSGKEVMLFTTGNSRFEQGEIDAFAKRVEARGGRFIAHNFLRRGRIYWQKSREELIDEVRKEVAAFR
jgi:flavodoxin